MNDRTHTWDLHLKYHRCPACGNILESRAPFENRFGKYVKDLQCDVCEKKFSVEQTQKPTFGPFTGEPTSVEVDWDSKKN